MKISTARWCTCIHTLKHHKSSGRCREGCDCKAALRKAERKERVRVSARQ